MHRLMLEYFDKEEIRTMNKTVELKELLLNSPRRMAVLMRWACRPLHAWQHTSAVMRTRVLRSIVSASPTLPTGCACRSCCGQAGAGAGAGGAPACAPLRARTRVVRGGVRRCPLCMPSPPVRRSSLRGQRIPTAESSEKDQKPQAAPLLQSADMRETLITPRDAIV